MATLPPEITNIADSLMDKIKGFDFEVKPRSVGTVISVYDGVANANGAVLIASHLGLGLYALWKSQRVDLSSLASIRQFYMLIWALFFAEYLVYTLATWL